MKRVLVVGVMLASFLGGEQVFADIDATVSWANHWVSGAGWSSGLVFENHSPVDLSVDIGFFEQGWPDCNGGFACWQTAKMKIGGKVGSQFTVVLTPGQTMVDFEPSDSGPGTIRRGWLYALTADRYRPLPAFIEASLVRRNGLNSYASRLQPAGFEFTANAEWSKGGLTAIAVTNNNSMGFYRPALTIRVFDERGRLVATQGPRTFPVGEHDARFLGEFFAGNPEWEAYLRKNGSFKGTVEVNAEGWPIIFYAHTF